MCRCDDDINAVGRLNANNNKVKMQKTQGEFARVFKDFVKTNGSSTKVCDNRQSCLFGCCKWPISCVSSDKIKNTKKERKENHVPNTNVWFQTQKKKKRLRQLPVTPLDKQKEG